MTPQDPRQAQPAQKPGLGRGAVAVAIPALVALALGLIFVMPSVFAAAATTSRAESVWAGPAPSWPAPNTPTPTPEPAATTAARPTTAAVPQATITPTKRATTPAPAKTVTTTTTTRTTTSAKPAPAAATTTAGPFVVTVNLTGGQAEIDTCKGPVLTRSGFIAQHASCGGTRFYPLKVGSLVTLIGTAVTPGQYRVTSLAETYTGSISYTAPHPYGLQTCMTLTDTRLWYLIRV